MSTHSIEHRLAQLERRIALHERMRADPTTGLRVVWSNGVPTVVRDALDQIPVVITGYYASGATYCWQEETYNTSGQRVMSGSLMGGSGALSGSNLMVEANGGHTVASFPLHTWARRRMYTLPSQDVWEFDPPAPGSSSGLLVDGYNSGASVSGVQVLQFMNRDGFLVSGDASGAVIGGSFLALAESSGGVTIVNNTVASGVLSGLAWSGVRSIVFNGYGTVGGFQLAALDTGDGAPGNQTTCSVDFVTRGYTGAKKVITSGYCQSGTIYLTVETWNFLDGLFLSGG